MVGSEHVDGDEGWIELLDVIAHIGRAAHQYRQGCGSTARLACYDVTTSTRQAAVALVERERLDAAVQRVVSLVRSPLIAQLAEAAALLRATSVAVLCACVHVTVAVNLSCQHKTKNDRQTLC